MAKVFCERTWLLDVPDGWLADRHEECVTIYDPNGVGSLQISTVFKDSDIIGEELHEFAREHLERGARTRALTCGDFVGITLAFSGDDQFWRHWYLRRGQQMLFVTYNCLDSDRGVEVDVINRIMGSLRER